MYIIYFIDQKGNSVGRWEVDELPKVGHEIVLSTGIYFIENLTIDSKKDDDIHVKVDVIDILNYMKKLVKMNRK